MNGVYLAGDALFLFVTRTVCILLRSVNFTWQFLFFSKKFCTICKQTTVWIWFNVSCATNDNKSDTRKKEVVIKNRYRRKVFHFGFSAILFLIFLYQTIYSSYFVNCYRHSFKCGQNKCDETTPILSLIKSNSLVMLEKSLI